ncbi:tetratricopeptide repeat protein [Fimbriiglobus ruber]|uniref:TPR repeat n=1 Tax=Fimbriiglobus ruber TaxID=1908690 RepID=A0A225E6A9_9BACT|nr:tetratricopeptide repeat protein [Fimbriiglobus ruber]OWK43967.1 TPR repeat [Fimbriiglobus ruber]
MKCSDWWRPLAIVVVVAVAYHNSFAGAFVFDDYQNITENPVVRAPLETWPALLINPRPVARATFAVNYLLGGDDPWGYHAVNLLIHTLAALTLYDLVRRSLLLPSASGTLSTWSPQSAADVATASALVWAVHPLTTQAVTYIVQRMESLAGLCILATLYALVRGASAADRRARWGWYGAAVIACGLGMGSKEGAVVIPILALLFDRCVVAGSFCDALRVRRGLYVGLAATWVILWPFVAPLLLGPVATLDGASVAARPNDEPTAGFSVRNLTPLEFVQSQPGVIVHYLRLATFPYPQCFDYNWPVARSAQAIFVPALFLMVLCCAAVWALVRRPRIGFLAAAPFIVLAPTSSVMPIQDLAVEHRMYLALAPLVVLAVLGVRAAVVEMDRRGLLGSSGAGFTSRAIAVVAVAILTILTVHRNEVYESAVKLWAEVVERAPENGRAHYNLGAELAKIGRNEEAVRCYSRALALFPIVERGHVQSVNNLGTELSKLGRAAEAAECYRRVTEVDPENATAYFNMGIELGRLGRAEEAIRAYQQAVQYDPSHFRAMNNLGTELSKQNRGDEAIEWFRRASVANPSDPVPLDSLGMELGRAGRLPEAATCFRRASELDPARATSHYYLGITLLRDGQGAEAVNEFKNAVRLAPDVRQYREALATAQGQVRRGS